MKKPILIIVSLIFTILQLSACVKQQPTTATNINSPAPTYDQSNTALVTDPNNQNINDTNYQDELKEQSDRADTIDDSHAHGGGHGR